ncbi:hypothetical protein ASG33_21525 [Dyadobacter sp. Leaf189]|nr:hypothetical protein ASG33_21525 [Dyadobacter sp. Leaf189]
MIRKKTSIVTIICLLAFAVAAYLLFSKKGSSFTGEGRSSFRVETFQKETGWAYRIYQDTIPVIEQATIPGVPGNNGFRSEELAKKTGTLVTQKLDQGIFPPTISLKELDSLGVKY